MFPGKKKGTHASLVGAINQNVVPEASFLSLERMEIESAPRKWLTHEATGGQICFTKINMGDINNLYLGGRPYCA